MDSVIITGANGFIGQAVTKYCLSMGINVCALVHNNHCTNLHPQEGLTILSCDMSDKQSFKELFANYDYDTVFHFAWAGSAGEQRSDLNIQLQNVRWGLDIINVANEMGCDKVIIPSSIYEDETIRTIYEGEGKIDKNHIYGATKSAFHLLGSSYASILDVNVLWGSITNAYGVGEISPRLINSTIRKCINGITPEFTSGMQNYDFVYIDDVARAFYLIGKKGHSGKNYIIGSGKAKPLRSFLEELNQIVAPELTFKYGVLPYRGINIPIEFFNNNNLLNDTGFTPCYSFKEGCIKTFEWLQGIKS